MIDSFTKKPIRVSDDDDAGPYIIVRLDQLGLVEKLLDDAGYHHDVDEDAISINDHPYATIVHLGRHADVAAIQRLLDENQDSRDARQRVSLPLVRTGKPGSLRLTAERIAEILEDDDLAN
jgi:hypothetical protein